MAATISKDHHYIPKGYLKRWVSPDDDKMCVFQHQPQGLVALRLTTTQTGYQPHLYTAKLNPKLSDNLERNFFGPVDDMAAKVIDIFTDPSGKIPPLTAELRNGWTRFLMSLMHRSPKRKKWLTDEFARTLNGIPIEITPELRLDYQQHRLPDEPPTLEEYFAQQQPIDIEGGGLAMIAKLSDSEKIGNSINGMVSNVITVSHLDHELLTSDQPLVMSAGLNDPSCWMTLAIGPGHMFVCANSNDGMAALLRRVDSGDVTKENNASVCQNAERYVYGTDDRQFRFVKNRFPRPAELKWPPKTRASA